VASEVALPVRGLPTGYSRVRVSPGWRGRSGHQERDLHELSGGEGVFGGVRAVMGVLAAGFGGARRMAGTVAGVGAGLYATYQGIQHRAR
jgi:hypothetical protein